MNKPSVTDPRQPSGSALILVLLMIVLLATIAVSFLSTARVEQIATRNFTRQTAARGLADLATGEAMAQIAEGFNMTNDGALADYTEVITTQPGAITKYFFEDGNCSVNTEPSTFLYTTNGGDTVANLNNLANPGSDNTPTDPNTPTVTGVLTDELNVPMQDVTNAQGDVIGRVAWYTDDESTKINLNAATRDRTTLNVSTPRSMSLSAVPGIGNSALTAISNIVDGGAVGAGNMTNWSRFFRDGQGAKALGLTPAQMANISTAPLSDYHLTHTPWGTQRLHINDLPITPAGVETAYAALTNNHLRNIYNSTFAQKYGQNWSWNGQIGTAANTTVDGLKQTIANMLQMRSSNTANLDTGRYKYTGAVLSETGQPGGYYAHTPFACINELHMKLEYTTNANTLTVYVTPMVEMATPETNPDDSIDAYTLELNIDNITYDIINGANVTPVNLNGIRMTKTYPNPPSSISKLVTNGGVEDRGNNGTTTNGTPIPAYSVPHEWRDSQSSQLQNATSVSIANVRVDMGDVKIYAGTHATPEALRDWLPGSVVDAQLGTFAAEAIDISDDPQGRKRLGLTQNMLDAQTMQRIDQRVHGNTAWTNAPTTLSMTNSGVVIEGAGDNLTAFVWSSAQRNQATDPTGGHNSRWSSTSGRNYRNYGLAPFDYTNRTIPPDPSSGGSGNQIDYFTVSEVQWQFWAQKLWALDADGNALFNAPHDLGKVPSNVNFRRLRFMPRHTNEAAANLIPDWAMLDVISFSSTNTDNSALQLAAINPRGAFACDPGLNATPPAARSNNLMALASGLTNTTRLWMGGAVKDAGGIYPTVDMIDDTIINAHPVVKLTPDYFRGANGTLGAAVTNIARMATNTATALWSTQSTWAQHRTNNSWPTNLVLPGEITEVSGVTDYGRRSQYRFGSPGNQSVKENEGRLSAFFPGLTLQGNFFTIYSYAQVLDRQGEVQSEAVTKTLVEVEQDPSVTTYPPKYQVKKLYTEPVAMP